jgi:hypothetical protein
VHASSARQVVENTIVKKIIVANAFYLASPGMKVGAVIGSDPTNQTSLYFFNIRRTSELTLGLFNNQMPGISMNGEKEDARKKILLSALSTGPSLSIGDRRAGGGLSLSVDGDGRPVTELFRPNGAGVLICGAGKRASPVGILLTNASGSTVTNVTVSDRLSQFSLFDDQRHIRAVLGMMPGKNPSFILYDRAIRSLLEMTTDARGKPTIKTNNFATHKSTTLK